METAVLAVFILLAVSAVSYRKNGKGLGFLNYENYKTFVISKKGNISTITMGELPIPNEIKPIEHRKNSAYDSLGHNEKILYDALLTRSYQILNNVDLSTTVNVPIDNMDFGDLKSCETFAELKQKVLDGLSELKYEDVYRAIHLDYDYLTW